MKRVAMILLTACLLSGVTQAQDEKVPDIGLTVRSTPSGASVVLKGDVTLVGITPTHFEQRLAGEYKVTARKHLYERRTVRITIAPDQAAALDIQLSPKTRFKAVIRSLLIPGYGQWYSEQPTKGLLFNVAALGTVTGALITNNDYQKKYDSYRAARQRYNDALQRGAAPDDLDVLYSQYRSAEDKANSARNTRRAMFGVTAGVWALNILDAVFFFPKEEELKTLGVTVEPVTTLHNFGFAVTKKF